MVYISQAHAQVSAYQNIWTSAPQHIPNDVSVDAPLLGNGDVLMSVGFNQGCLRYYLSKNDFWRLQSKADLLSGPRVGGYFDLEISDFKNAKFSANQLLSNGLTTCTLHKPDQSIKVRSWVAATDNLIFIEIAAIDKSVTVSLKFDAPGNGQVRLSLGKADSMAHLTREFIKDVTIPTKIAIAFKVLNNKGNSFKLEPGKKITVAIAVESLFKQPDPLNHVVTKLKSVNSDIQAKLWDEHNQWWKDYWQKSSIYVGDTVLMKAYYQGLYTMAACARDERFAPALFGWPTGDAPRWNGDYHMNYNFVAPFYGLHTNNRLEQSRVQDVPLLDFMPRANWYAKQVTHTRGLLYPVGIGPLGVEVSRDFPAYSDGGYTIPNDIEAGGLFYRQRSNALFGTINMAQYWRTTHDIDYGKKIYPYILGVVAFWEDYLKLENGRYVIFNDAEGERSDFSKNPAKTLAMLRNALDLIIDLSANLKRDIDRQAKWKDILNRMSDYPTLMQNGKQVFLTAEADHLGKPVYNITFEEIYPGNGVTLNSTGKMIKIAKTTVDFMQRWIDYNYTSSFYVAAIRVGYDSIAIFNHLHQYAQNTYPNGYQLNNPAGIENSGTVANALSEMLCMSVGNVIRLFRVWPQNLDAHFEDLRTWGAFLVSARLSNGMVSGVKIKSEKGLPCSIINPWGNKEVRLIKNGKTAGTLSGYKLQFSTAQNEVIELLPL
jgi:alpha-L-fucosidase 2